MGLCSILLLALASVLACGNTATTSTVTASSDLRRNTTLPFTGNPNSSLPKRSLRRYADIDEERMGGKLPELAKAATSKAAKIAETTQLKTYLILNKNALQVLKKLKLGRTALYAVSNPKLEVLSTYVKMFNEKHPEKSISLIKTLTTRYGDDALAGALVTAEKNAATPKFAEEMQALRNDQLMAWGNADKSADVVFQLLKFRYDGYGALTSPKLDVLEEYIKKLNTETSEHITLLNTFRTGFGENILVSILSLAKTEVPKRPKALTLEAELITKWMDEKLLPERVFKLLNLQNNVEKVLESDRLSTFLKYIEEFNKKNPDNEVSFVHMLTANYGEATVAAALASGRKDEWTEDISRKLQSQQLMGWLNSGKSVDDVVSLLRLQDDGVAAITNGKVYGLRDYIKLFNHEKSEEETLAKALAMGFGGEDELASLLMSATSDRRTKEVAKKLQKAQFTRWMADGIDPMRVLSRYSRFQGQI